jgi:hypothetical protein
VRLYTVHIPAGGLAPGEEPLLVEEGFCWPALFFSFLWALWHRMWLVALLLLLVSTVIEVALSLVGANIAARGALNLGFALFVASSANDWRRAWLARRGFRLSEIVASDNEDAAGRRWGDAQPGSLL